MRQRDDQDTFPRGRRKHRRVTPRDVTATVRVGGATYSYVAVNLSRGGLLVSGDRAPPRGASFDIELRRAGVKATVLAGHLAYEHPAGGFGLVFDSLSAGAMPAIDQLIAAIDAQGGPPPLPGSRSRGKEELPASPPADDPFTEGPDPRPPRTGSTDERNEYLRVLLKRREEALVRGKAAYAAARKEASERAETVSTLESRLVAALAQAHTTEVALEAARKALQEHEASTKSERAAASEAMEEETRHKVEAIGAVAELESSLRRVESELVTARKDAEKALATTAKRHAAELERARSEAKAALEAVREEAAKVQKEVEALRADSAALRKTRGELAAANKKLSETQAALTKERVSRESTQESLSESLAAQQTTEAETIRLGGELARLKSKLMVVENALERASGKAKTDPDSVARRSK